MMDGNNLDDQMTQNLSGVATATIARSMATYGEHRGPRLPPTAT
jgi:hypothetical protein